MVFYNAPVDEVLLNDALQYFRRAGVVPSALRIHHRHRPLKAHAKAICLGAKYLWLHAHKAKLLQPVF